MKRLFVALGLPEDVRRALAALGGGVPGARWVPAENHHVTLRFIGEVDGGLFRDIQDLLAGVRGARFELTLRGVDHFGGDQPRQIIARVVSNPALSQLRNSVEAALGRAGLPAEGRKFQPHVTLARLKGAPMDRLKAFEAHYNLFAAGPFAVTEFSLYSSYLSGEGAIYTAEATYPLG
ncbi:MAG: RNA 2',3'-cyclic phosphodiesterase [Alphaproteobacteria bacterium]|nr:RNA 2',3'-cyclic phosphodiesterase [Alphaproteobacteria bacterium]